MSALATTYSTTQDGLKSLLSELGIRLRYNTRARRIEYLAGTPAYFEWAPWSISQRWETWDELISVRVKNSIHDHFFEKQGNSVARWTVKASRWQEMILGLAAESQADPFWDWLSEHETDWDGTERIETLLSSVLGAEDTPLTRWASRYLFVGPIERAENPGSDHPEIPVLVGPQGVGKSSLLRELFPYLDWYGDTLDVQASRSIRDQFTALVGKVMVEITELPQTASGVARLQEFLARTDDGHRPAYEATHVPIPRRACIVATSNTLAGIPSALSRHLIPVEVPGGFERVADYQVEVRNQLWAEAMHQWDEGEWLDARLPDELRAAIRQETVSQSQGVTVEDVIAAAEWQEALALDEIAERIGLGQPPLESAGEQDVVRALKALGWEKTTHARRRQDRRVRLWEPPGQSR